MSTTAARKPRRGAELSGARRGSGPVLTLQIWEQDPPQLLFSIPRSLGTAVRRNRLRRQLKEIVRRNPAPPGWSVLIKARADWGSFQDLEAEYRSILISLGGSGA